jgi:hypothetical protein
MVDFIVIQFIIRLQATGIHNFLSTLIIGPDARILSLSQLFAALSRESFSSFNDNKENRRYER